VGLVGVPGCEPIELVLKIEAILGWCWSFRAGAGGDTARRSGLESMAAVVLMLSVAGEEEEGRNLAAM
jgi:hypothetical protein